MSYTLCKHGETQQGATTLTLERDGTTLVFKGVPAQVCLNCGEAYVDEPVSRMVMKAAEDAARVGVVAEIREYISATA